MLDKYREQSKLYTELGDELLAQGFPDLVVWEILLVIAKKYDLYHKVNTGE